MRGTCVVPRVETVEIVKLTKSIDGALVSIMAALEGHAIAQDLVGDLTEIASATRYVRGIAEQSLEKPNDVEPSDDVSEIRGMVATLSSKARPQ